MKAVSLSWVATAYILAAAVFMVPLGRLADIHGRKKVFVRGRRRLHGLRPLSRPWPSRRLPSSPSASSRDSGRR